ncbi:unnamed protein product [Colias eurytheme]|nr:unnamed protein product [Colias eurytheme]
MSGSGATTPTAPEPPLDERDLEPRTPMKRLGSTRKLAAFNTKALDQCYRYCASVCTGARDTGAAGESCARSHSRGKLSDHHLIHLIAESPHDRSFIIERSIALDNT